MQHTHLLATAALFAAGLFSSHAAAHEPVVAVGFPPVVVDTGFVTVAVGLAPPPPPVIVVERPRTVVVERVVATRPDVVVVRERDPVAVVVDDRCDHPGRGHHHGKHKHGHRKWGHRGRGR